MKNKIYKLLSIFCALSALTSMSSSHVLGYNDFIDNGSFIDKPNGKMSTVYGYVMNDYFDTYGVISEEYPRGNGVVNDEDVPTGVVYGDIVNFDNNDNPYLIICFVEGGYNVAACHIWSYNEETEKAKRIAILEKDYSDITSGYGKFELGWNDEKRFIVYSVYENEEPVSEEYYTVIDNEAFLYVNQPGAADKSSIMRFNSESFTPDIDVSDYNQQLGTFFDGLKNAAASSVSYEDILERIEPAEEEKLSNAAAKAINLGNFDINNFKTLEEYEKALDVPESEEKFYLLSNIYNIGNEIYYVLFSTDYSYYNYALLRRTENEDYQILKVCTDCIPLSDRELRQTEEKYSKSTLLTQKAKKSLKLSSAHASSLSPAESVGLPHLDIVGKLNLPKIHIEKTLSHSARLPAACIGGGISLALLTLLWVYIYGSEDE